MNSKERILTTLKGDIPDRVPFFPVIDEYHVPKVINQRSDLCFFDGMKMAEALLASAKLYGSDGIMVNMGLGKDPHKILGCKVTYSEHSVPLFISNFIKNKEDIIKISTPDPWAEDKMKPVKHIIDKAGGEKFITGSIKAPFEYAYIMRGSLNFMEDIYEDPAFVKQLMLSTEKITLAIGEALIETGVDALVVKDSVASSSLISPKHYAEFAFPFEKRVIQAFRKKIPVILHICRNTDPILEKMAETGAHVLEIDSPVNLADAKRRVGSKIILKGNVDAVEVVERGDLKLMDKTIKTCMDCAKEGGRYILSTGDSIPYSADQTKVKLLSEFTQRYGGY